MTKRWLWCLVWAATACSRPTVRERSSAVQSANDPLARTPPMGWSSWNPFGDQVDESRIQGIADAIVARGLAAAGYQYVNIDEGWWTQEAAPQNRGRDAQGSILYDRAKFPHGMKAVADYIHARGLKAGIYTDSGTTGCGGGAGGTTAWGSLGHYAGDFQQFADWGFDYVKVDMCGAGGGTRADYEQIRDAIAATGRKMVFSICTWDGTGYVYGPTTGNLWRTGGDIAPPGMTSWQGILNNFQQPQPIWWATAPGGWNDPDMMVVGLSGISATEGRAHFSMWAMLSAPLIMGLDLRAASADTVTTLTNPEVIAIDQDPAGTPGIKVSADAAGRAVYVKPLGRQVGPEKAVLLLNAGDQAAEMQVAWRDVGLGGGVNAVRDVWQHSELMPGKSGFAAKVAAHEAVLLRVSGQPSGVPSGTSFLSDDAWTYAATAWGPVERDMSNGELLTGDGHAITIAGVRYAKGLGVHAESDLRYALGGRCTAFLATVGVDDEVMGRGAVVFEVWLDGRKVLATGTVRGGSVGQTVDVDVSGAAELQLRARLPNPADYNYDHADWADARITCN
jgi:alpha-galactosidase